MEEIFQSIQATVIEFEERLLAYSGDAILDMVKNLVSTFHLELKNLIFFYHCIDKWSHAHVVFPTLKPLVTKMKASLKNISIQLNTQMHCMENVKSPNKSSILAIGRKTKKKRHLENMALELVNVFSSIVSDIKSLKPEIRQVLDFLSKQSIFPLHSPLIDFDGWHDFVNLTKSNLESILSGKKEGHQLLPDLATQIFCFNQMVYEFMVSISHLARTFPQNPDLEGFMYHFGTVVTCAALVYCDYWFMGPKPDLDKMTDMTKTLLDLLLKIDFITPVFVDMNLHLLKGYILAGGHTNDKSVDLIVRCLLGLKNTNILSLRLIDLIKHYISLSSPQGNPEDSQRFSVDVKQVIMRARSLQTILHKTYETSSELVDILTLIWLLKVEIFLRCQLSAPDSLFVNDQDSFQILEEVTKVQVPWNFHPVDSDEKVHQILTLQEEVATVLASNRDFFLAEVAPIEMLKIKSILLKLLVSIMLFKAKSSLVNLLSDNDCSIGVLADKIKSLTQSLEFLKVLLDNLPADKLQDGKSVFNYVDDLCRRIGLYDYSVPTNRTADQIRIFVPSLRVDIKLIRDQLKQVYSLVPTCKIPKTDQMGFLDSLLGKLREWMNSEHVSLSHVKHLVEEILESLELLTQFLKDKQGQGFEIQDSQEFSTHVLKVAYEIEYVLDSMLVGVGAEWHNFIYLLEDIRHLKLQISTYHGEINYEIKANNTPQISSPTISQDKTSGLEMLVVGFHDQEEAIIDKLTRGLKQQDIVSIIGMPGIGKTTLAKKVYNNINVQHHFHFRAWCCVSQYYEKRRLLLDILSHFVELAENVLENTEEDLELQLYQRLKGKKFLIVMDDMWDTGAWDDLRRSLPDDGIGSRTLITSRLLELPLKIKDTSHPHLLSLLSVDESWDLLQRKIFYDKYCPEDLETIGKEIARSCSGLPLSIVAIAGLLKKDKRVAPWKVIAERLNSLLLKDTSIRCMDILELSYNNLSDHLKACYLYFGALSVGKDIPALKLLYLWMAEGFVKKAGPGALEDIAESYLMDLISRSLVTVTKGRSNGGVKTCRIHDLLLDFCLSKAKEENFFRLITRNEEPYATFDGLDYGLDIDVGYPSDVEYDNYRVCIQAKRQHFVLSKPSGPGVRSLQFYASADMYPRCPYDFSFISENFKLLKVLDVECINMGISFPRGLESLIHLRYLAVSGDIDCVPSYISSLQNLETLFVNGLKGRVVLPDTLWLMKRLRLLHVNKHVVFSLPDEKPDDFLENLVTLSYLLCGKDINHTLRRLPSLKNLRCMVKESVDQLETISFPRLDLLSQLESLTMIYYGRAPSGYTEFTFPFSLKKLTLSNFRLPWNVISGIGRLENLEILKLYKAFEGETWDMVEGEFSKLKFLKLDSLDIVHWNAYSDHLPNLEQLVVQNCGLLEEVSSSFSESPTLQRIKLKRCTLSCEESVQRIEEDNEAIEVVISFSASSTG